MDFVNYFLNKIINNLTIYSNILNNYFIPDKMQYLKYRL